MRDSDLPTISGALLAPDYLSRTRCAFQLDRLFLGQEGTAGTPSARFDVVKSLEGAAKIAYTDRRIAVAADFRADSGFTPEQVAVFEAGVAGHVAMFPEPALARDAPSAREVPEAGVRLTTKRPFLVETDTGLEVRRLQASNQAPAVGMGALDPLVLAVAPALLDTTATLRVLAVDLLALETAEVVVDLAAHEEAALDRLVGRVEELRALAAGAQPKPGADCAYCRHVWNCPAFVDARR